MPTSEVQADWPSILSTIVAGTHLSADQARWAMRSILDGTASQVQIAGFGIGLRARGETSSEIAAFVEEMLEHAHRPWNPALEGRGLIDTCGTGGDRSGTANISTMAAIVAGAAGATVAKHGNRAASSASGSADVLEALGLPLGLSPDQSLDVLVEVGITFFFAPAVHPTLATVAPVRRELGAPTTFNLLGPLANPLQLVGQSIGLPSPSYGQRYAEALIHLKRRRALVVSSSDGLDELSPAAPSYVWEVHPGGRIDHYQLDPAALGIRGIELADLRGGTAQENARLLRETFAGRHPALAETTALNAAAAVRVSRETAPSWEDALEECRAVIESGAAEEFLERWLRAANAQAETTARG